jgi:hypothetical protein
VMEHHYNTENPDKPLWLLVPGAMIALAALGVIIGFAYQAWYAKTITIDQGVSRILLLAPIYAAGVFVFSYGYELYDVGAAIRLTLIVVVVTALSVLMVAALFAVLSGSKDAKSAGSSKSSPRVGGSSGRGFNLNLGRGDHWVSSTSSPPPPATLGPIVPVPPPIARADLPPALACPACGQSFFLGSRTLFCPSCGKSIPAELLNAALGRSDFKSGPVG